MKYTQFTTSKKDDEFIKKVAEGDFAFYNDDIPQIAEGGAHPDDIEGRQIKIYPEITYQTFKGIGGALTESSAVALQGLPENEQEKVIDGYFGENGIGYTLSRTHIGSCDFSLSPYSYIEDNDNDLKTFSLKREENTVLPLIKAVLLRNKKLFIFSSPWSPVPFMKTNGDYRGGKLKKEYYDLWAKYVAKYVEEYKKAGVNISAVTVQNEPRHHQLWESCNYTKEEEVDLINTALNRELNKLGVKIYVYDHCGERLFERAEYAFKNSPSSGIAFHWYSGTYFEELRLVREQFPDKDILMSEGCEGVPYKNFNEVDNDTNWNIAFLYSKRICEYFKNGLTHFCDWNICLDENFAPYHFRENRPCCAYAPVICDKQNKKAIFTPSYYAIGQYSKFVKVGAKILGISTYTDTLNTVAFSNPDKSIVLIVHNETDNEYKPIIKIENNVANVVVKAKSVSTFIIK